MTHRLLAIAVLFGVLAVACGKVGPPVRLRAESVAAGKSETTEKAGASAAEESEEEENQP
jgi:predicted small lipoprotein YifL